MARHVEQTVEFCEDGGILITAGTSLMTASDGSLHNVPVVNSAALEYIEESRKSPESQSSSSRIVTNKKKRLRESDIIVPDFFGNKTELVN